MFIYFLLLGIFLFLFFNESKHSHYYKEYNSISIVFFIILTLIMGLRDFSVGVDTELYYRIYTQVGNDVNPFYKISPIYYILIKFLNFLNFDYRNFLFIIAIIINVGLMFFIYRLKLNLPLALFSYIGLTYFYFSMNGSRQIVALVIAANALIYLFENLSSYKGWFLIITAFLTHITSCIFLIAIIGAILSKNVKNKKHIFVIVATFTIIIDKVYYKLLYSFIEYLPSHYMQYLDGNNNIQLFENFGNGRLLILYLFLFSVVLLYIKSINRNDDFLYKSYPSIIFCAILGILNAKNILINRLLFYLIFLYIPYINYIVKEYYTKKSLVVYYLLLSLCIYSVASILLNHNGVVPYKFF